MHFEITTCDPSMYTTDHPDLTISNLVEKSDGLILCNILQLTIHYVPILGRCYIYVKMQVSTN